MADEQDQEYNGAHLVGTCIAFLCLSWLAVALRTYTRAVLIRSLKMDDWLMLVSQIIFTASCAFLFEGVKTGMGRHNDAIADDDSKVAALKWQAVATITYILNMMFIKLSIGVFLLRVSVKRVYNYTIRASLVVIVLWSLGIFLWDTFQCTPVEKQWDYRIEHGKCAPPSDIISAAYAISVMTIVSDWLYALLPIPMLWSVKMTTQAKATVIVILGLGVFASIATLVRIRYLGRLQDSDDLLFSATDTMTWTVIEPGVAIVASSLATIRPLLRAMKIRGFESTNNNKNHNNNNNNNNNNTHSGNRVAVIPSAAPSFGTGPNDVSLRNVEPGRDSKTTEQSSSTTASAAMTTAMATTRSDIGLTCSGGGSSLAPAVSTRGHVRGAGVYASESGEHSPAWSTHGDVHDASEIV